MKPSQADKIFNLLLDGQLHTTQEIQIKCYGADHLGSAAITSRISEIRVTHPEYDIPSAKKYKGGIFSYQMTKKPVKEIITIGKKFETKKWFDPIKGWQKQRTAIVRSAIDLTQLSLF